MSPLTASAVLALGLIAHLPVAIAHASHGADTHAAATDKSAMEMSMGSEESHETNITKTLYPPSYFTHSEHAALLYSHIALMIVAWVFILPITVMLSISKSRCTVVAQLVFAAVNAVSVVLATLYNAQTPDLYPNNAHHKIGWIVTLLTAAQCFVSSIGTVADIARRRHSESNAPSNEGLHLLSSRSPPSEQRLLSHRSSDSALDTDSCGSPSTYSASSTLNGVHDEHSPDSHKEMDGGRDSDDKFEDVPVQQHSTRDAHLSTKPLTIVSTRVWQYIVVGNAVVDRIILPTGFIALITGIATLGRFFEGQAIFAGLAHWIKGGVFFWFGLLTLGRWSGSFGDMGWAWNLRPASIATSMPHHERRKWRPSAEFTESFLIFFYGSTNIFLEHLGNWGGSWSASDFEHLAITVLFLGGGACGMIIESTRLRALLNVATEKSLPREALGGEVQVKQRSAPEQYKLSINPIPALVILLLGVMMSSHHQSNMTSTMIHKQWGQLLVGAAFARGLTYLLVYLRPPTSALPSRPPTEVLVAFGLIAGGLIFMASASDIVDGIIHYDLDTMFMYTVTMGLVGLIMAWELIVLAIKGFATSRGHTCASLQQV